MRLYRVTKARLRFATLGLDRSTKTGEQSPLPSLAAVLARNSKPKAAWQHFEDLQLRYEIESLKAQRSQFSELNQELKLEVAGLRAPSRIDEIARRQLRLTAPVPGQVAPLEGPFEPVVAQVRPSGPVRTQ